LFEQVTIPEEDYKIAVETMAAEAARYNIQDAVVRHLMVAGLEENGE
jgi:hypothetical protein